jgi:hypothetical protein
MPHTTASAGFDIRPARRLRITEAWLTDRLHSASQSSAQNTLLTPASLTLQNALSASLATNYSQNQLDLFYDLGAKVTLRGGYRYVWGDAMGATLPPAGLVTSDLAKLRRNTGIAGIAFRPNSKLLVSGEAEVAESGGAYFRTSLYNYQRAHAQARYDLTKSLNASADFTYLGNQNPTPGVGYDFRSAQESLTLFWLPKDGKFGDLEASYSRSDLKSDISYFDPTLVDPVPSRYRENAHTGSAVFNLNLPYKIKLMAGGSFFISSGSRPTSFFEPRARVSAPIQKHATLFAEWSYYGYGEAFYLFEGFRAHAAIAGNRLTR